MKWNIVERNHSFTATLDNGISTNFELRRFSKKEQRLFETYEWYLWFRIGEQSKEFSYRSKNKKAAIKRAEQYIMKTFLEWMGS